MESAKVTTKGQITLPIYIRKKLGIRNGEKVVFIEDQGRIVIANAAKSAFSNLRAGFDGEAQRLGIEDEQDIVALVNEVRSQLWEERYEDNA